MDNVIRGMKVRGLCQTWYRPEERAIPENRTIFSIPAFKDFSVENIVVSHCPPDFQVKIWCFADG